MWHRRFSAAQKSTYDDKRKITCLACSPQEIVTHVQQVDDNFARIGTAYLHLTAGYTDIKMLIAKDLLLKKNTLKQMYNVLAA